MLDIFELQILLDNRSVATLRGILVMCVKMLVTSIFFWKLFTNLMAERTRQKMTLCGSCLTFIHNLRT
jgi:hypothetical protein